MLRSYYMVGIKIYPNLAVALVIILLGNHLDYPVNRQARIQTQLCLSPKS